MRGSSETLEDQHTLDTIETKACVIIVLFLDKYNLLVLPMPTQESDNATQRYRGKDAALTNAAPDPF